MSLHRSLVVLLLVLTLVAPLPALAEDGATPGSSPVAGTPAATPAATGNGVIAGTVKNGTPGGGGVGGLEVRLTRFRGTTQAEESTTTTAQDGTFRFERLPVNQGEAFVVTVRYQGVDYYSDVIALADNPETTTEIAVYEPTDDASVLAIASRGIIIAGADRERGALEIFEIVSLDNTSDRAYVGRDGAVLRIPLPQGATQIIQQPGFNFGQPEVRDGALVTTGAITPGSHDAMFAYLLPYEGRSLTFEIGTAQPTDALSVLIEDGTYEIASPSMQDAGTATIGDTTYRVLTVERPVVGDVVAVTVSDLPRPGSGNSARGPLYAGIAAVLGLVVAGGLMWQTVRRRREAAAVGAGAGTVLPDDPAGLEDERLALAAELNRLDEEHAAGQIDDATYQQERDEILEDLRAISRRLRGLEDSGG